MVGGRVRVRVRGRVLDGEVGEGGAEVWVETGSHDQRSV